MSSLEIPGSGEAGAREERQSHHQGFNEALDHAVEDWARNRGDRSTAPGEHVELQVTLKVLVSKTNPGRIEGYVVGIG